MGRPFAGHPLPSREELRRLFEFIPETGELIWKPRSPSMFRGLSDKAAETASKHWASRFAGKVAGTVESRSGYVRCFLNKKHHLVHRIIWKMKTGEEPEQIDHLNGVRHDNRPCNLRSVSQQINAKNRRLYASNLSGVNGVSFHTRDGVWTARISAGRGVDVHLGNYPTKQEAVAARFAAERVLEYHENHGTQSQSRRGHGDGFSLHPAAWDGPERA